MQRYNQESNRSFVSNNKVTRFIVPFYCLFYLRNRIESKCIEEIRDVYFI